MSDTSHDFSRREFHQWALAALGGIAAGSLAGCPASSSGPKLIQSASTEPDLSIMLQEKHVCRGLNTCKGKGKAGDNACAGQGTCATFTAHSCSKQNECKGQGGCGSLPGANACKGQGHCGIPLQHVWDTARQNFEKAMKAAGKEVGAAPAAA